MADSDNNMNGSTSDGATSDSGGGSASGSNSGGTNSDTNDETSTDVVAPETPKAASGTGTGSQDTETEQTEGMSRTADEPKQEAKKEEGLSLTAAFNEARMEGISLGINDAKSLDNYAKDVGNRIHDGQVYNPIEAVRRNAGDMAAAVAQFITESNLATKVGVSEHSNVGNGLAVHKQGGRETSFVVSA